MRMSTRILAPLIGVLALVGLAWVGTGLLSLTVLFGVVIPYTAVLLFLGGFVLRVLRWGKSAVPFVIPTTTGQQKTLPWIKQEKINNPDTTLQAVGRMALEVLFFRSLFKNTKTEKKGETLGVGSAKWLWLGALVFHWSMLIVLTRHLRLFLDPVPVVIQTLGTVDTFLQVGVPPFYITGVLLLCTVTFLFLRRVVVPRVRYISLAADFFPLFLLIGIALSGILMRHFFKADIIAVKEFAMGLVTLHPILSAELAPIFYIHLFMVSSLIAYFPMSKLMHAGGIFLAPTRNLPNNSRSHRHVNPWNYPVKVHTYAEYEDDFREKMVKIGLPVEKELPPKEDSPEGSAGRGRSSLQEPDDRGQLPLQDEQDASEEEIAKEQAPFEEESE